MKRFLTFAMAALFGLSVAAPALADQQEQQIGAQVYQQLQQKGEILTTSPYYKILNPIAARIASVANPQYDAPFHFILVHETSPNAFAVPGGNVYVTDSMMTFAKNKEELAGVLCHETSHTIHHDVIALNRKQQNVDLIAGLASAILGNSQIANFALGTADQLVGLRFSRTVEGSADHKGAETCARAGINPWGMVWLFRAFEANPTSKPPEALSDHPTDEHRISDLENEFAGNPSIFGKYSGNVASATPLDAPGFRSDVRTQSYRQAAKRTTTSLRKSKRHYCCGTH
ncbi:MAG: M48 family metallopeptidase [Candidatus Eremiobacteraeota bacterium]|nr:M48 family metallopeptidase [Candidatus Eremiobacteraeota bacterium]